MGVLKMIDRIIEFRKECGWFGAILFAGLVAFAIGWWSIEIVDFLNKVM